MWHFNYSTHSSYALLHYFQLRTATPLTALMSRVNLRDLANFNRSVSGEVFLKLSKFCQPHHNFGNENDKCVRQLREFFVERLATLLVSRWSASFSGAFAELRRATISFISVRLSFRMEQLSFQWTDFIFYYFYFILFYINFIFEYFSKICWENSSLAEIW
jgi:hypothetical protein